ncbi:hypothetical protein [Synechococcus sp. A15-62]|uniref:hypothetical protein n=1 Tax=Synechococcus sp. A15-62 TaxID=1050657 RepID=UPI001646829F|nr:hypothetical protein [Synechococcus sp. A15-62]
MKRILVIGNSHLAAIKLGWDQLVNSNNNYRDTFILDFYGSNNIHFVNWTCLPNGDIYDHQASLVTQCSNYDHILIVSMTSKLDVNQYAGGKTLNFLSLEVIKTIVHSYHFYHAPIQNRAKIVSQVLIAAPAKAYFLGAPCRPQSKITINIEQHQNQIKHLIHHIRNYSDESLKSNSSISFLVPPTHLLCSYGISTPLRYLRDHNPQEIHGNSDYGREILIYFLDTLMLNNQFPS